MATAKVLSVPELLEAILLHLPPKDMLLAPLINMHFKDAVTNSIRIQRALFFQPNPKAVQGSADNKPRLNPFLDHIFGHIFDMNVYAVEAEYQTRDETMHCSWLHPPLAGDRLHLHVYVNGKGGGLRGVEKEEESWRRMLVGDPPCTAVDFVYSRFPFCRVFSAERLGEFVDTVEQQLWSAEELL